jgi:phosphoglycerol transferase MdoB-like AlkP superfamily enzyme
VLCVKWKGEKALGLYFVFVALLSFASILSVFAFKLPLDLESPELFVGLAIPMHFFPALAYFTLSPFFHIR